MGREGEPVPESGRGRVIRTAGVFLAAISAAACGTPPVPERFARPMDRDAAFAIVSEAFSKRAHPNPWLDEPKPDRQILGVTETEVRFREMDEEDAPAQTVRYRDVSDVVLQHDEDVPSKPDTILVHVREGSPSATTAVTRSDLMTWIGVTDPYVVLPGRDHRLAARLEEAIDFLRYQRTDRPPIAEELDRSLREVSEEESRADREAEARRRQERRVDRTLEER